MELFYIRQILAGDLSKFTFLVENYKDMAYSIALRMVNNQEDAEDVVQDSFIKVYQSLGTFRQESKFSTWFYKIVVNTALTKVKRKRNFNVPDVLEFALIWMMDYHVFFLPFIIFLIIKPIIDTTIR